MPRALSNREHDRASFSLPVRKADQAELTQTLAFAKNIGYTPSI
jgi:hypothetical protein